MSTAVFSTLKNVAAASKPDRPVWLRIRSGLTPRWSFQVVHNFDFNLTNKKYIESQTSVAADKGLCWFTLVEFTASKPLANLNSLLIIPVTSTDLMKCWYVIITVYLLF